MKTRDLLTFGALLASGVASASSSALAQVGTVYGAGGASFSVTGPVNITQTDKVNVVGVVQEGPVNATAITQTGFYNRAVVVQFGTTNAATVAQDSSFDRAHIFQFGPTNNLALTQNGPRSTQTTIQDPAGDPRLGSGIFVNNLLFAPETVVPQIELGQAVARTFTNTLFNRLDANRYECPQQNVNAAFSADLPRRVAAPAPVPVFVCPQFSLFATGTYGHGERDNRIGVIGSEYDLGGVSIGAEYRINPNLIIGSAFNYTRAESDLNFGFANLKLDAYQGGMFGSVSYPNWFFDAVVTYGSLNYDVSRPGFVAPVTASPDGNSFTAAAKSAYLFDAGGLRLGPLGGLTYIKNWVDGYTESGDPLLTQSVAQQELESLTGSAGIQVRLPMAFGASRIEPYLNVTAEHEFLDNARLIATTFTLFPTTSIVTPVLDDRRTFGKVGGGVRFELSPAASFMLSAESTFARESGDDFALNAGAKIRF